MTPGVIFRRSVEVYRFASIFCKATDRSPALHRFVLLDALDADCDRAFDIRLGAGPDPGPSPVDCRWAFLRNGRVWRYDPLISCRTGNENVAQILPVRCGRVLVHKVPAKSPRMAVIGHGRRHSLLVLRLIAVLRIGNPDQRWNRLHFRFGLFVILSRRRCRRLHRRCEPVISVNPNDLAHQTHERG